MYDITAAGHLLAGESEEDGVREIQEELGIQVSIGQLTFLDAIPNSIKLPSFIDNEISLVYLYEVKAPLIFNFVDEEVEGLETIAKAVQRGKAEVVQAKQCPSCRTLNILDAKFCNECGNSI